MTDDEDEKTQEEVSKLPSLGFWFLTSATLYLNRRYDAMVT
jgi:hypothetical protein